MKRFGLNSGYIGVDRRRDEAGIAPLQKAYLERIRGGNYSPLNLLLDLYPDAAAAYSLRKLRSTYIGNAIRVRRSSDNTEQDIGFVGGDLDTSALTTFCSGTNGFVTTWYDQSGNNHSASQPSAVKQPQIINGGTLVDVNSKPTLSFNGTNQLLLNSTLEQAGRRSVFYVKKGANLSGPSAVFGFPTTVSNTQLGIFYWNTSLFYYGFNTWNADSWGYSGANVDFLNQTLEMALFLDGNPSSSGVKLFINNSTISLSQVRGTSASRTMISGLRIGTGGADSSENFDGFLQELVIWNTDYSTINRSPIKSNINTYYNIY